MFAKCLMVLSVISIADSASIDLDSNYIQELIAEAVENILSDKVVKENERYLTILKEIETLKERNDRMQTQLHYLEQENTDKYQIICSMQKQMNNIIGNVADKVRNVSLNNPEEFHTCQDGSDKRVVDKQMAVRRKRQAVPTHSPSTPRIAFSAYLTHTNSHLSPGDAIRYDHVLLNEGSGYNPYTGSFTAPISGTYLFMFQFDARVHTFVRLSVDGKNIVDAVVNPHINTQDRENMSGNSAIIHVGIGQAVIVEVYDAVGEAASSDKYRLSTFSGFLLHPET